MCWNFCATIGLIVILDKVDGHIMFVILAMACLLFLVPIDCFNSKTFMKNSLAATADVDLFGIEKTDDCFTAGHSINFIKDTRFQGTFYCNDIYVSE